MSVRLIIPFLLLCLVFCPGSDGSDREFTMLRPTPSDGEWFFIEESELPEKVYHLRHAELFGRRVTGYNYFVLKGVDAVQSSAMDGGGYFIGITAQPPESPVGYELKLFGKSLLKPPRKTSYCSGSTYGAFIEALNIIFPNGASVLSPERLEAMRMQEPDGGRREDGIKFWGHWNDDGYGNHFALVQYSGMGDPVEPRDARPGDFMNISWKNGGGHSVIFLGWIRNEDGSTGLAFWSSQGGSNGYGDVYLENLDRINKVKIVRLTVPENLFSFNVNEPVNRKVPGDLIH